MTDYSRVTVDGIEYIEDLDLVKAGQEVVVGFGSTNTQILTVKRTTKTLLIVEGHSGAEIKIRKSDGTQLGNHSLFAAKLRAAYLEDGSRYRMRKLFHSRQSWERREEERMEKVNIRCRLKSAAALIDQKRESWVNKLSIDQVDQLEALLASFDKD